MDDILASIRRIIADDQQSTGSRLGARRGQPANAAAAPVETVSSPVFADREEILDLARFAPESHAAAGADGGQDAAGAHHDDPGELASEPLDAHGETARGVAIHRPDFPAHGAAPEHFASPGAYEADEIRHDGGLLATPMSESVMSAFEALAATVVLENKPMLEGILRDLMRPMLKAWLDDNLPGLVERLVRIEIERVARGGRS